MRDRAADHLDMLRETGSSVGASHNLRADRHARRGVAPARLGAVDLDHRAVGLEQDDDLHHRVEDGAEARFARAQRGGALVDLAAQLELGFLDQRDVGRDADIAEQPSLGVAPRLRDAAHPAIIAGAKLEPRLDGE